MIDVVGFGSAYVDYFFQTDKSFLKSIKLKPEDDFLFPEKNIDRKYIFKVLSPITKSPGGISSNTISTLAHLKVKSSFYGVIGKDADGDFWLKNMNLSDRSKITRIGKMPICACLLTKNGKERTFLSQPNLHETDFFKNLDFKYLNRSKILHIGPFITNPKVGINKTLKMLEKINGPMVSFTPSIFYIERAADEILPIIAKSYILFVNGKEIRSLTGKSPQKASKDLIKIGPKIVVCTLSSKGALVTTKDQQILIGRHNVDNIMDTTGAGDAFAAGFLYGILNNKSLTWTSALATKIAAKSLSNFGLSWQK